MLTSLCGIWVPLATPMHHGDVDFPALQNLADGLIAAGAHGLVVCGTTGEASQLDLAEQGAALAAVLEVAHKRCPVLLGIGGSDTFAAAGKALQFDDTALAGYLVSTPAYVRPSQEGLVRHFEAIAEASAQPIVLYNVPARTGVNLELATARRLAVNPQFVGIKEAGGSLAQMTELVRRTPLSVLCGDDALLFAALCGGAHGAISAAAHIRVDLFVRLFDLVRAQRLAEARELFDQLLPVIRLLFSEPNPAPLKAALSIQGRAGEELRLPMTPASTECKLAIAAALEDLERFPVYRAGAQAAAAGAAGPTPVTAVTAATTVTAVTGVAAVAAVTAPTPAAPGGTTKRLRAAEVI